MRYRSVRVTFAWALVAAAPPASSGTRPDCPRLSARWYGDNRAHLQQVIDERGTCAGRIPPAGRPAAAFDWDNTVTKNDVTDAKAVRPGATTRSVR
jgi:hypothetical protein